MVARKSKNCRKLHCYRPSASPGGLCQQHIDEETIRHQRREVAISVLHTGSYNEQYMIEEPFIEEWKRVRRWWHQACDAYNNQRTHPVLHDETEYALDWCVGIAQELIDAQRDVRAGKQGDTPTRQYVREQFWERFENMEKGLMSNGIARAKT